MPDLLENGPKRAECTVILAHGAGAAMDTDFMNAFAKGIANAGHRVIRFEFPYMAEKRRTGKKKAPNREPQLRQSWTEVLAAVRSRRVIIGGKSMGGRIASLIADEAKVDGLVCLGYPFHPVGKPEKLRTEHLAALKTPTLIVQGERDTFGKREEVADYTLPKSINIHWLTDGDHSFKPRKASGLTAEDNWASGVAAIVEFLADL